MLGLILVIIVNTGYSQKKQKLYDKICTLENEVADTVTFELDEKLLIKLHKLYNKFEKKYSDDTLMAYNYTSQAIISEYQNDYHAAAEYYKKAYSNFPDTEIAPEALFKAAFLFENLMFDNEAAKKLYELFLKKYPNHPLKKDAESCIKYLGTDPEEMIKMFQEENNE